VDNGPILADILSTYMEIDADRVVMSNQNFKSPKDDDIFIIVIPGPQNIIATTNRFDPDADEEIVSQVVSETFNVEITSRNSDALTRRNEIAMAIRSTYSEQIQEQNNIRIFRTRQTLDLSFIEGSSALHRYRIPVIIQGMEVKRTAITPIDKFPTTEVANGTT